MLTVSDIAALYVCEHYYHIIRVWTLSPYKLGVCVSSKLV